MTDKTDALVALSAIKDAIQPLTDGRSTHNVHTRQVARDILQRIEALAEQPAGAVGDAMGCPTCGAPTVRTEKEGAYDTYYEYTYTAQPAGAVAWAVFDAKHIRFTVYSRELADAIAERGLLVLPMFGGYEWFDAKAEEWKPIDRLPYTWERELGIPWRVAATRPAAAAVVPEGLVLVPRVPTFQMVLDGVAVLGATTHEATRAIYTAMLAAAPAAPKGGVVDAIRERLVECRDWFDQQADVISKGGGSTWDMLECREQRDLCKAALATGEQS